MGDRQLRVDWARVDLFRLRVSYGFSKKERDSFTHLLDELYEKNARDVLWALKRGQITPRQLMAERRAGRHLELDVVLNTKLALPLWDTLDKMIGERHGGEKHKRRMRDSLKKLRASGILKENSTVADLRTLTKARIRPVYQSSADFNHARKAILTPLSQLFGDPLHPFRREVLKALGQKEKEPKRPLSVTRAQFWALVETMPERSRACIITLAATGMRLNTEFYRAKPEDLRPNIPGLFCRGSKTADAQGIIHVAPSLYPDVEMGITKRIPAMSLRRYFVKARDKVGLSDLTLHDLRHLTAIFAFEGGAKLNEVQAMLRHSDVNQTARYAALADRGKAAEAIGRAMERPVERGD